MSELLKGPEHHELLAEHVEEESSRPEATAESPASFENEHQDNLEQIRNSIEQSAVPVEKTKVTETEDAPSQRPSFINRELKMLALKRNLALIQRRLSKPDKLVSKVIHQPVVAKISELSQDTVARPSGLLGGGILALIGSSVIFYMAKHYGFEYNFLAFFVLFVGGFGLGLLAEFGTKLVKR